MGREDPELGEKLVRVRFFVQVTGIGISFQKTESDGPYMITNILAQGSAAASGELFPGDLLHGKMLLILYFS